MNKRNSDDDGGDDNEARLLTPKNAAKQLDLSVSQIYRLVDAGKLVMLKLGYRAARVTQESIDRYIKGLPRR